MLESAEIEANMSSQQKLSALMKQEDSMMQTSGDSIGFIKKFNNRQDIMQQQMVQKASYMVGEDAPQAPKKQPLPLAAYQSLDMNEIGDSDDSVTALQAQLKD